MFGAPAKLSDLDKAIASAYEFLAAERPDSERYEKIADQIVKLHALKTNESKGTISADTWAAIGANIGGILLIIGHERAHVVTSKALNFLWKLK